MGKEPVSGPAIEPASGPAPAENQIPADNTAKKLDDSMDTAEPLSKKRRVSWIDERMRKPLHEVKYIAKENVGKKAAEAKGQKISKEILLASNSTKDRMRKFVYSCPPRKLQMN